MSDNIITALDKEIALLSERLRRLQATRFELAALGYGGPPPKSSAKKGVSYRSDLLDALELILDQPLSVPAIVRRCHAEGYPFARTTVNAHLLELVRQGRARRIENGDPATRRQERVRYGPRES